MDMAEDLARVLSYWFGEPRERLGTSAQRWFKKDAAVDDEIRERFLPLMERAQRGELVAWTEGSDAARGSLALIVLLDQMSRNVYRGSPRSFEQDGRALAVCLGGLGSGLDLELAISERYMFYMPLMHAEDAIVQRRCVERFEVLARDAARADEPAGEIAVLSMAREYAEKHALIIERFGRFPHRNEILGRASTDQELEFLKQPGSSF
ncbi:MAG: DUF924 domain-containing protein [Myxococcales bacterium]|nr:DUF924 domain-containing protein [Myxococcales bacterium]